MEWNTIRYKDEVTKQEEYFKNMSEKEKKFWLDFSSEFEKDNEILKDLVIEQELFFQSYSSEIEFSIFQSRINTLLLYVNQNKDFIDNFVKIRKDNLEKSLLMKISAESAHSQEEAFYDIEEYFNEYLYVSINGILYSLLETTLKNIARLVGEKEEKKIKLSREKKSTIRKYIEFIQEECNLDINLPNEFWVDIELLRKVRNNFTHSLNDDEILNQLKGYTESNNSLYKSYLTYDFCLKNFGVICEIIEGIEKSLCEKYPESGVW
ncbi:hypothetical protein JMN23_25110 [Bacillus sp. RHFB]|nr:hypothetical protein [Bacillus sp. RHFB]